MKCFHSLLLGSLATSVLALPAPQATQSAAATPDSESGPASDALIIIAVRVIADDQETGNAYQNYIDEAENDPDAVLGTPAVKREN